MSKLKLSANLFLEVAELENFRRFIVDDGYKAVLKSMINNYGIVRINDKDAFLVLSDATLADTINIAPGVAFTSELDRIVNESEIAIQVPASDIKTWIVISRSVTNYEKGTVSVTTDGTLTGSGTEFTKVLRGGDNFPNAVKFIDSKNNVLSYEVVNVVSDTSAVIAAPAVAENNIRYGVVGAFTPGFIPSASNELIYEYDSCQIRLVQSASKPEIQDGIEFILAEINWDSGSMAVVDMRDTCTFNTEYSSTGNGANTKSVSVLNLDQIGNTVRIGIENAYIIESFEIKSTSLQFVITNGHNNVIGSTLGETSNIPNDAFAGWKLFNRATGISVEISGNSNNILNLKTWNSGITIGEGDDFIIVPPYDEIEIQMVASGATDWGGIRTVNKFQITDGRMNIFVPLKSGQTSIKMSYRYISNQTPGKFYDFPQALYNDGISSTLKTLMNSTLTVNAL